MGLKEFEPKLPFTVELAKQICALYDLKPSNNNAMRIIYFVESELCKDKPS